MINHLRTLLLNLDAGSVTGWYCDPSFVPAKLSGPLAVFETLLFAGVDSDDVAGRQERVRFLLPFAEIPELSGIVASLDTRTTEPEETPMARCRPSGVADFLESKLPNGAAADVPDGCVNSTAAPLLFASRIDYSVETAQNLALLRDMYVGGTDLARRFSACLLAYVLGLEHLRQTSLPRTSRQ